MDSREWGEFIEQRALRILRELKARYRDFVLEVRRASPKMDALGIDCFVRVRLPKDVRRSSMSVPIQLKSSPAGVERWKIKHPALHKAGVLAFYIPHDTTDRQLRNLIFRALKSVQINNKDGRLYASLIRRLAVRTSQGLRRVIRLIKRDRARYKL